MNRKILGGTRNFVFDAFSPRFSPSFAAPRIWIEYVDGIKQLLARYLDEYLSVDRMLIDGFPFGELLHENDLFKGHSRESVSD